MVAISAEYRIESAHGTTPAECVKDAKSALRWLRRHATELGIDPDRLAAGGGSAGGHLAAATAAAKGFDEADEDAALPCRPNALVLFNPVLDNGPEGYSHERFKDFWRDVSPMHNIDEKTPPTIVFLGSKDALIPVASVEKYKKLMEAKGRRCELRVYEGRTHGFFNYRNFEDYTKTVEEMDLFLESLGYLKGKPGPKPPTNDAR
jgi:acetyl esterase/lipase